MTSIQQAAIKVVQEVKKFKRGLTLHDIHKRTQVTLSPALMEELKANPHLIWSKVRRVNLPLPLFNAIPFFYRKLNDLFSNSNTTSTRKRTLWKS